MEEINKEVLSMIKMIDFTNCKLSSRNLEYGGRAGAKKGIIFENAFWFLKFPKSTSGMKDVDGLSYVTSPLHAVIPVLVGITSYFTGESAFCNREVTTYYLTHFSKKRTGHRFSDALKPCHYGGVERI